MKQLNMEAVNEITKDAQERIAKESGGKNVTVMVCVETEDDPRIVIANSAEVDLGKFALAIFNIVGKIYSSMILKQAAKEAETRMKK